VAGIRFGAINAALIAGNCRRKGGGLKKLREILLAQTTQTSGDMGPEDF